MEGDNLGILQRTSDSNNRQGQETSWYCGIAKLIHGDLAQDTSKHIVFAFAPSFKTSNAFLRFVMEQFGVKTDRNYAVSLQHFEQFLVDQYKAGVSPILLVDSCPAGVSVPGL